MSRRKKRRFKYIDPQDIIDFHNALIEKYGGSTGEYADSLGKAESVLAQQYYAGTRYKTIESRAAYLIYLLAKGHIFPDGNKRTALLAGSTFLLLNGFYINATDEQLEQFMIRVADSDPKQKDMVIAAMTRWIGSKLKRA